MATPRAAAAPITWRTLQRHWSCATSAAITTRAAHGWNVPLLNNTGLAKKSARLAITPTTTAVMALRGAPRRRSFRLASTKGAPARMKPKEGRKVNHTVIATAARARGQGDVDAARA